MKQMYGSTKVAASNKYYKHLTGSTGVPEICCLGVNTRASKHLCEYKITKEEWLTRRMCLAKS